MATETKGSQGKSANQKLKTYLVMQYLLRNTDERHPALMHDNLQTNCDTKSPPETLMVSGGLSPKPQPPQRNAEVVDEAWSVRGSCGFVKEEQRNEREALFDARHKKVAASDVQLATTWWRLPDSNQ